MRTTLKLLGLLYCVVGLNSLPAKAAANCSISTAGVAFGAYDSLGGTRRDTIGTVTVTCMGNVGDSASYSIALDTAGNQGVYRLMTNGTHQLDYLIFADNSYTQVWGDGSGGTVVVTDSFTLVTPQASHSYPMYGRIPGGQSRVPSGVYGADITITLIY
ncbi:MAG: spore coat U domain-containing protein [Candidatus Korobacteraceae bacterium]